MDGMIEIILFEYIYEFVIGVNFLFIHLLIFTQCVY